jgi:3-phenylpropionate/trans-cinnamate dioxygenase ferredoxin reductase subunit
MSNRIRRDVSRVAIVGAQTAGFATAEALRAEGFDREIVLIGAEAHLPYNRPSLSKQVLLGTWAPDDAYIADDAAVDRLSLDLRMGSSALGLDPKRRTVATDRGPVNFDALVIATGSEAVLPAWASAGGSRVRMLRSHDDAVTINRLVAPGTQVAVVGAGLLGSEIAATLCEREAEIVLIGRGGGFRLGAVGTGFSHRIRSLHEKHGVRVLLDTDVVNVEERAGCAMLVLSDGRRVSAELIVAAVGSHPSTGWLSMSGLPAGDGVRADETGRAAPGIFAVGDAASWRDPTTGHHIRSQHQQTAIEQAQSVARTIMGGGPDPYPLPFFWSELYDERVQVFGRFASATDAVVLAGDPATGRAVWGYRRDGVVSGLVGWNAPKEFRIQRAALINDSLTLSPA